MISPRALNCLACALLLLALGACQNKSAPSGGSGLFGSSGTVGSAAFLQTKSPAMSKWLDQRVEVAYKHMPPQLIFDQVPLNDQMTYHLVGLPTSAPPFNFSRQDISRRELLAAIARHWNLQMTFDTDASGTPVAIRVQG